MIRVTISIHQSAGVGAPQLLQILDGLWFCPFEALRAIKTACSGKINIQRMQLTDYHAKYFAHKLSRRYPSDSVEKFAGAVASRILIITPANLRKQWHQELTERLFLRCSLLVLCTAFRGKADCWSNLTVKNIPRAVLSRCEWGHDDYSLQVENLPKAPAKPGQQELFGGEDAE